MREDASSSDLTLLKKIAELYYEENLTQAQIARQFNMSRSNIQRLLQLARDKGIVQITIRELETINTELQEKLECTFGLKQALVTREATGLELLAKRNLPGAAAQLFADIVQDNHIVGIGWGRSVLATVLNLPPVTRHAKFVPVAGGLGQGQEQFQINEISRKVSQMLEGIWLPVYAPGIVVESEARDAILSATSISGAVGNWDILDVCLVGIGAFHYRSSLSPILSLLGDESLIRESEDSLKKTGAVGNICDRYFRLDGSLCDTHIERCQISITFEQLRRVPNVLGVAFGPEKVSAIYGALNTQCLDVLATDEETAGAVLKLASEHNPGA